MNPPFSPPSGARIIDSHTGGEPTRVLVSGGPDLGTGSMAARLQRFRAGHDHWRRALVTEPRGNDVIVGALLCDPQDATNACGVIYFNNAGFIGMCGHGTIGLVATLAYMGRLTTGTHGIETPVGVVQATLHEDGSVSVANVRAYRHAHHVAVQVPGVGLLHGDVAWGGNWFFLCHDHGLALLPANIAALTARADALRQALTAQGVTGADGAEIDHIELMGPAQGAGQGSGQGSGQRSGQRMACDPASDPASDSASDPAPDPAPDPAHSGRSFVLCPGGAYDRSPCGTGTSATLACLAADGTLAPGQLWRQESVIGSVFSAHYTLPPAGQPGILPTIHGRAHVTLDATVVFDAQDPFAWGLV